MLNQDVAVVAGQTDHLIEDVPMFQEHPFIVQARNFTNGNTDPITYYAAVRQNLTQIAGVERTKARQLLARIEMTIINGVNDKLRDALVSRMGGDTKATKPADLYRKYAKTLQSIVERN